MSFSISFYFLFANLFLNSESKLSYPLGVVWGFVIVFLELSDDEEVVAEVFVFSTGVTFVFGAGSGGASGIGAGVFVVGVKVNDGAAGAFGFT